MYDKAFINASPCILLARGGHGDLIRHVASEVFVPEPVAMEIKCRDADDPGVKLLEMMSTKSVPSIPGQILEWGLGCGESSVIALGLLHPESLVLLDDLPARKCARALNLPVCGTLGIVLSAKRKGIIALARPVLEDLLRGGMYLSKKPLEEALSLVGE